MAGYLKDGELNPQALKSYGGFIRIFSAWILDESLPWTTGEAPTLQMLFKYLSITYKLPSDTTVKNQLALIFTELYGKVVPYAEDTWTTPQMVYTFGCTVGTFINDEWEIIERVIDFKVLEDKEHEGIHAGKAFVNGAAKIGGLDKISLSSSCHDSN
ncbi:hypothetical protein C8J56DRAFT_785976 [Mycena floridula]|nr:hypothetical protein C8J56DRAFT_785976 [Mycena floridula]